MAFGASGVLPAAAGGQATRGVALTGDQRVDGILTNVAWSGPIEFSFPTSGAVYRYAEMKDLPAGYFPLSDLQKTAVRFALDADTGVHVAAKAGFAVEGFTNLGITHDATPDTDQVRVANTRAASVGTAEVADFPGNFTTAQMQDNGDSWFGTVNQGTTNDYVDAAAGNYAWHTHLHEMGHTLGLKHAHEYSLAGPVPAEVDSLEFTVMTYRTFVGDSLTGYKYEHWGAPQTYMMLDIAALQHMYGADYETNAGNTVYAWSPASGATLVNGVSAIQPGSNRVFATIWDGGGIDTYDLSRYASNLAVDLRPGEHSVFSQAQLADLGGGPNGGDARGNIFNALLFEGDTRSLIERAIGGSGNDRIVGNQADNRLTGNAGNDVLVGGLGKDQLIGGAGNDRFDFDRVSESAPGALCDLLRAGGGGAAFDRPGGGSGGDRIDLATIDANLSRGGNQTFVFGGDGIGHVRCVDAGNLTRVLAHVDGDGRADFQLDIQDGAAVLAAQYTAADFIL